jgi:plasmid stability protein
VATLNIKDFPDKLHRKLQAIARKNRRSLAQEVTHILDKAIASDSLSILELRGLGKAYWIGTDAVGHVAEERRSWD